MKKIIAIAVAIVVVLGTVFYFITQPRSNRTTDQSQAETSTSQKSSSAKSSESSSSSEDSSSSNSQASSTAPAGNNNAGNNNNASNPQPTNPQSNLSQSSPTTNPSQSGPGVSSAKTDPVEGQGHAVHNGQDAIDVVRGAYIAAGTDDDDMGYELVDDLQYPNDFDVKIVLKSIMRQGGTGTAGIYRVSPDGHYVLIT